MREQAQWAEHAAFMDELAAQGLVVLGGPLGQGDEILLVMSAKSEQTARACLAADPWSVAGLLTVRRVLPWTILLDARDNCTNKVSD